MTFSYNANLPNPPDDPADDVSGMQVNAMSINSLVAVDHVGFNLAGGGRHNQVTFNSNNVPVAFPVTPPVMFTDLPTNHGGTPTTPEYFFYSGTAAQSSAQYVLAGSGSALLAGGIIMKWGTFTLNNTLGLVVPFASAFPNNVFSIVGQSQSGGSTANQMAIFSATPANFTAQNPGLTAVTIYNYIAIGN